MKNTTGKLIFALDAVLLSLCACSFIILKSVPLLIPLFLLVLVACCLLPLYSARSAPNKKLRACGYGYKCLCLFLISVTVCAAYHIVLAFFCFPALWATYLFSVLLGVAVESVIFRDGMLCVYLSSTQLGIKLRVLGVVFGFVPIANIVFLIRIIRTVRAEVYYGEHSSAASVADSAAELAERVKKITADTGCEKVNIIAHSKGGLDCRYAVQHCGIGGDIASLTTINMPHRGCLLADWLLGKAPEGFKSKVALTYNATLKKLGEKSPDFLAAVNDLTSTYCVKLDKEMPVPPGILCKSVGSKLNRASGGKFPLNLSYLPAKYCDGPNDGLVGESSFSYGSEYSLLTVKGKRGISHGDVIDLNRENIPGFDVREFYVQLVSDLKNRGL